MAVYRFVHRYSSGLGTWEQGSEHPFDDEVAAHIMRDSPGCLEAVADDPEPEPEPATRAKDAPPHDRQMKAAPHKRGA